jgi:hypothetical protein
MIEICCGIFFLIIIIMVIYWLLHTFIWTLIKYTLIGMVGLFAMSCVVYIIGMLGYAAYYVGIELAKINYETKKTSKKGTFKSSYFKIAGIFTLHGVIFLICLLGAIYFELWYIKMIFVAYVSAILGLMACFPVPDEELRVLIKHNRNEEQKFMFKFALNTFLFISSYYISNYAYYHYLSN